MAGYSDDVATAQAVLSPVPARGDLLQRSEVVSAVVVIVVVVIKGWPCSLLEDVAAGGVWSVDWSAVCCYCCCCCGAGGGGGGRRGTRDVLELIDDSWGS